MNITKITLHNFRNFNDVSELALPPDTLLVAAAPNAFGKTNLLESIVLLLRGKSFRASAAQCVKWGHDSFTLRANITTKEGDSTIAVRYHSPTKKLRIEENNQPTSLIAFLARYPLVLFLPEDSFLFNRSPALRRNFINQSLTSFPSYIAALVQYHRALRQRNVALKKARSPEDILGWTDLLAEHGSTIWKHRERYIQFINTQLADMYERLSGDQRKFKVRLQQSDGVGSFVEKSNQLFKTEKKYGYTLLGPHRDDFVVETNKRTVPTSLSQGEMRNLVIAIKCVTALFIENLTGERPVFLLDEVLSELDYKHRITLLDNLPPAQKLLTCTAVPKILQGRDNVHVLDLRTMTGDHKNMTLLKIPEAQSEKKQIIKESETQAAVH
jgi:DNA replication and repair protein RecF